jgi:hypothetical protein
MSFVKSYPTTGGTQARKTVEDLSAHDHVSTFQRFSFRVILDPRETGLISTRG